MTTGFRVLRSTDGGAPTLSGTAGSLIGVLDALLNIGGGGTFWAKAFTGTNKAAYRSSVGERFYLRVDDAGAQVSAVRGFATMSDVDTGTGIFPTTGQETNWGVRKSNTANSTARAYIGLATDRFFYLLISGGWTGSGQELFVFGEPIKLQASDTGTTVLKGVPLTAITGAGWMGGSNASTPSNIAGAYTAPGTDSNSLMPFATNTNNSAAAGAGVYFSRSATNSSVPRSTYPSFVLFPVAGGTNLSSSIGLPRVRLPFIYYTQVSTGDVGAAKGDTFTDQFGASFQLCYPDGTTAETAADGWLCLMTSDHEAELA